MRNFEIERKMYEIARELIEKRYPTGWGRAAVIHTTKDSYFSSVPIETANGSAVLCIEVGAMCEAHKYNEKVSSMYSSSNSYFPYRSDNIVYNDTSKYEELYPEIYKILKPMISKVCDTPSRNDFSSETPLK